VDKKPDLTADYKGLWQSALGKDIMNSLMELHNSTVQAAENEKDSMEKGYGLLKEASGVMLAITHLKGKGTSVLPKARRNATE